MNRNKLELVGIYPDVISVNLASEVLSRHDISSFIEGGESANTLSLFGSGVVGVRLLVNAEDCEAAKLAIVSEQSMPVPGREWYCDDCKETMGPAFDSCWSCGQPRQSTVVPVTVNNLENVSVTKEKSDGTKDVLEANAVDEIVLRAYRASIFGLVFLPFFFHLYSSYLLITVAARGETISPTRQRMFFGSVLINALIFLLVATYLRMN